LVPARRVAAAEPLVFPNVIVPLPKALLEVVPKTVPASMVRAPKLLLPLKVNWDVVLFSTTVVTLLPTAELITVLPELLPALVRVPALLMPPVEKVIVPLVALLMVRLLLPVTPPVKVAAIPLPLVPMVKFPLLANTMALE